MLHQATHHYLECTPNLQSHQSITKAPISTDNCSLSPHSSLITARSASHGPSHTHKQGIFSGYAAQCKPIIGQQTACGISLHTDNTGCMRPPPPPPAAVGGRGDRRERGWRRERREKTCTLCQGEMTGCEVEM